MLWSETAEINPAKAKRLPHDLSSPGKSILRFGIPIVKTRIKSPAFRRAKLKSEEYRNIALICLLSVLAVYATFRALAAEKYPLLLDQLIIFAVVIGYEAFMFAWVRRTLNRDGDLPRVIWPVNILIETQIPTIAIIAIIENEMNTPF